jgi:hypothetical protein
MENPPRRDALYPWRERFRQIEAQRKHHPDPDVPDALDTSFLTPRTLGRATSNVPPAPDANWVDAWILHRFALAASESTIFAQALTQWAPKWGVKVGKNTVDFSDPKAIDMRSCQPRYNECNPSIVAWQSVTESPTTARLLALLLIGLLVTEQEALYNAFQQFLSKHEAHFNGLAAIWARNYDVAGILRAVQRYKSVFNHSLP